MICLLGKHFKLDYIINSMVKLNPGLKDVKELDDLRKKLMKKKRSIRKKQKKKEKN